MKQSAKSTFADWGKFVLSSFIHGEKWYPLDKSNTHLRHACLHYTLPRWYKKKKGACSVLFGKTCRISEVLSSVWLQGHRARATIFQGRARSLTIESSLHPYRSSLINLLVELLYPSHSFLATNIAQRFDMFIIKFVVSLSLQYNFQDCVYYTSSCHTSRLYFAKKVDNANICVTQF